LTLALTSKSMPLAKVEDLADTRLAQKISQLPGVGLVSISGGEKPAVRIQANPTALSARGVNLDDVRTAVAAANVDQAKGSFDGPKRSYTIGANDQLLTSNQYKPLIVKTNPAGVPVTLSDVATVIDGAEDAKLAAWMNDESAVIVNIQRQPGANIIAVVDRVEKLLPLLKASLPGALELHVLTDRTITIRASVKDVEFEMGLTIGLVVLVIFLFLRNFSATVIPSVAVPLSLIGTFGVMYLLGYSLNNLTLMALTISTGFVVDDAIVMIENIARFIEQGEPPLAAALKGAEQIGFTIVSLSISLIAVLIPLLFMGDIVGRLFREFAVTLSVTIVVSAVVSLTLTPMMSARLLKHKPPSEQGRLYRASERAFESIIAFYGRTLQVVLRHRTVTLMVAVATLIATIYLYVIVPKGFFPMQDTGVIMGISQASQSISYPDMAQKQQAAARIILQDPAVESLTSFIGADGQNTTLNSGRISINLKPINQRGLSASDVIRRLQNSLSQLSGIHLYMQPVQDITVDDRVSRTQYQYTLEDPDTDELNAWTDKFVAELKKNPHLEDVATDQQTGARAISLMIDRVTASRLGVAPTTIDNTLYDAYGQREINTLYTQLNQYHVILETAPEWQQNPANLGDLYIQSNASSGASGAGAATSFSSSASAAAGSNALTTSVRYTPSSGVMSNPAGVLAGTASTGGSSTTAGVAAGTTPNTTTTSVGAKAIPLSAFTRMSPTTEPLSITHQGQFPAVTVSFNLAPNASLGTAISDIDKVTARLNFPPTIQADFQGTAASFRNSLSNEALLILAALVTVYIVLGVLYESFIHPITILSTLPSAGVGALLALMLFHQDLSVVAIIGIILLIGIVKKNGILIVDFALEAERERGKNSTEAIYEASLLRFRPIMMTTMAALLAGLPLAFGTGLGSELRRPLGICMVGGLLLSQILTLYTTPVIYIFFDTLGQRLTGRSPSHTAPRNEPPPAGAEPA
ncbi:MAG TPA: efflux RND transporter permease subunit, partial [Terracidiphilus sp.]|nr:efflux RND transporter permease subunit [Terracidiphilus sp.]